MDGRQADGGGPAPGAGVGPSDALLVPLWGKAMNGDVKAVNSIVRISEQRSRLLGLDKPDVAHSGSGTLVDPAYWEQLKETHGAEMKPEPPHCQPK